MKNFTGISICLCSLMFILIGLLVWEMRDYNNETLIVEDCKTHQVYETENYNFNTDGSITFVDSVTDEIKIVYSFHIHKKSNLKKIGVYQ